jgi:MarR-like DNA-binding transcriptional regulator SgrR of sgrS sRNA
MNARRTDARRIVRTMASVSLLAASIGGAGAALGPRYGGDLTLGVVDLPAAAEPSVPRSATERLVAGLVHETLLGVGNEGYPEPALAAAWTSGSGGREWTLSLRADARFHDERLVTAPDALRSLRRFLRSSSTAAEHLARGLDGGPEFRARSTQQLAGLASSDPATLVVRFANPRALPLAPLASPAAAVTADAGAGAGPFVPTLRVPGRRLGLTSFGAHVRGRPFLDRMQLLVLPDEAALRGDLQSGWIDAALGEPGVSRLAATLVLVFDAARPPFDEPEARSAVSAAVDRAELVRRLIPGAEAATALLVPGLLPPSAPEPSRPAPALRGTVPLVVSREVPPLVSQRVAAWLASLGLQTPVEAAAPATAWNARAKARLLVFAPEVPEAGLALRELAALARADSSVAEALDLADAEPVEDRRRAGLQAAEAALRAEAVLVPLAWLPVSLGSRPRVHGARVELSGRAVLEDAWVEP